MTVGELVDILSYYDEDDELVAFKKGEFRKVRYAHENVFNLGGEFVGVTLARKTEEANECHNDVS